MYLNRKFAYSLWVVMVLTAGVVCAQNPVSYTPSKYRNLEKYWWYRYRLVNDFMKIGDQCGESIPMENWHFDCVGGQGKCRNIAHWGDATQHLGNYILALAGEWRILNDSKRLSTKRTEEELFLALQALERLDKHAEPIWRNYDNTYPYCNSSSDNSPSSSDFNGFFIRDDVPGVGFSPTTYTNFVMQNWQHFHRPGFLGETAEVEVSSDYSDRVDVPGHPASWPHSDRRGPVEESQDQLVMLYAGLGMTGWLLSNAYYHPNPIIHGQDLADKAKAQLYRMVDYIPNNTCRDLWSWSICNPVRSACVYGVSPDKACNKGGAELSYNSFPAVAGLSHIGLPNSISGSAYYSLQTRVYPTFKTLNSIFGMIYITKADKDLFYTNLYNAFADNIVNHQITKHKLALHSTSWDWCWPHIPYIWQIINGDGPGSTIWFNAGDGKYGNQPYVFDLLDYAPFCGCHNYDVGTALYKYSWSGPPQWGENSDYNFQKAYYWSTGNRLQDWDKRSEKTSGPYGWRYGASINDNSDYNNIDYMVVHNLNAIIEPSAFPAGLMNSYYKEDYDVPYGQSNIWFGSKRFPLKLNFLEYLSMVNKVGQYANFKVRGAKVIDLKPGFNVDSGATFDATVKDYACQNEGYAYALVAGTPFSIGPLFKVNSNDSGSVNTDDSAYHALNFPPDGVPFHIDGDSNKINHPEPSPDISDSEMVAIYDSLVNEVLLSGDSISINILNNILDRDDTLFNGARIFKNNNGDFNVSLFPNPNKGEFTIKSNLNFIYSIKIFNSLGELAYTMGGIQEKYAHFILPPSIPNGIYAVLLTSKNYQKTFSINIMK